MLYFVIYNLLRIFLWWHEHILARNEAESRQTLLINCLIINQRKSSAQLIIEEPERVFLLDVGVEAGSIWTMDCIAARLIPELQLLNNQSEISILGVNQSEISIYLLVVVAVDVGESVWVSLPSVHAVLSKLWLLASVPLQEQTKPEKRKYFNISNWERAVREENNKIFSSLPISRTADKRIISSLNNFTLQKLSKTATLIFAELTCEKAEDWVETVPWRTMVHHIPTSAHTLAWWGRACIPDLVPSWEQELWDCTN